MEAKRITDEARRVAGELIDRYENLCLMSGFYRGKDVVFVNAYQATDDGGVIMLPLFIVVTEDMMGECQDAYGAYMPGKEKDGGGSADPKPRLES